MRYILQRAMLFLLAGGCLLLLAACGGSGKPQGSKTPTLTPTPTAGQGQQLLAQSAQLLNSAQTLHGIFNATISGQFLHGELDSEIWRMAPDKSRTLALKSTLSQFASGLLIVDDGKQIWQYDPAKKIVYSGPASAPNSTIGTPLPSATQSGDEQQLILNIVQNIFEHSAATLVSSMDTVSGRPAYTIHVSPKAQTSSATNSFNYDGTVSIDQQTHLPLALDLTLQGLGRVQLAIPALELNKPLAADLFTFTPPPGTKVLAFPTNSSGSDNGSLTFQQAEQQAGYHLLSIPVAQTAYQLQSIDALGAPGNQIYTFNYTFNGQNFTISEGKALANLPVSGQTLSLRGTTATLATTGNTNTLSWTEQGVGIQISGPLSKEQIVAIANLLA